jgi:D-alanyl-D-alanine carboxypeptidase
VLLVLLASVIVLLPFPAFARGTALVPEFSLTRKDLEKMISSLPSPIAKGIAARPEAFLHLVAAVLAEPPDLLVLVDKEHALPDGYAPTDLVSLNDCPLNVSRNDLSLRKAIMPPVLAMAAAAKADGAPLLFSSTYRSYEYQVGVYDREVKQYGQERADRESARPGMSQHQLGTAVDFGSITDAFAGTKQGRWLQAHAWEYGFSLSYPDGYEQVTGYRHESWHYRYITRPGAELQREFFGDIQQYLLQFLHDNRERLVASLVKKG